MEQFDPLFYTVFQHYKPRFKAKGNTIALGYILVLQASLLLLIGSFFMLFFSQMHVNVLSTSKAWTLYAVLLLILMFRNWVYYTGKKRKILNSKQRKGTTRNIWFLWMVPVVCFIFAILLMQRL